MAKSKPQFKTAIGTAKYPHITEKDVGHQYSSGAYDCRLILSKEAAEPLIAQLKEIAKAEFPPKVAPKLPFKENEEGDIEFKFKSQYQPALIDARGKKMEKVPSSLRIRGGSKLRVAGSVNIYDKGLSLWMNQVQIIDLVQEQQAFDAYEGGSFSADDYDTDDQVESQNENAFSDDEAPAL